MSLAPGEDPAKDHLPAACVPACKRQVQSQRRGRRNTAPCPSSAPQPRPPGSISGETENPQMPSLFPHNDPPPHGRTGGLAALGGHLRPRLPSPPSSGSDSRPMLLKDPSQPQHSVTLRLFTEGATAAQRWEVICPRSHSSPTAQPESSDQSFVQQAGTQLPLCSRHTVTTEHKRGHVCPPGAYSLESGSRMRQPHREL